MTGDQSGFLRELKDRLERRAFAELRRAHNAENGLEMARAIARADAVMAVAEVAGDWLGEEEKAPASRLASASPRGVSP